MSVIAAFMAPHPPLIIPEVGKGEQNKIQETVDAYHQVGKKIAALKPQTIVIISPHNVLYSDYFHIRPGRMLAGDFRQFGVSQVSEGAVNDTDFVAELCKTEEEKIMPWGTEGGRQEELDHGTLIPLYFINQYYKDYKLASVSLSGLSLPMHYSFGQAIQTAADRLGRKTVVVASGDLSHYLKEEGPYGFHQEGPVYDDRIMRVMAEGAFGELLEFSEAFCHEAGECGHRAFTIMAGALDGLRVHAEQLSYQGTFGVGYGICTYEVTGPGPERDFLDQYKKMCSTEEVFQGDEDPYVALARRSLEIYVKTGIPLVVPEDLPTEMLDEKAGAFVSIHMDGALRGCIGTIAPVQGNIAWEIIENAVSAGTRDPRFPPVTAAELPSLAYSVDIMGKPERIDSVQQLDVKKYGVIVSKGGRRGLLLPDLDGVDMPEQQVAIAKQKAGIGLDEPGVKLERFQVIRHGEK